MEIKGNLSKKKVKRSLRWLGEKAENEKVEARGGCGRRICIEIS